jgi:hypothetical protein
VGLWSVCFGIVVLRRSMIALCHCVFRSDGCLYRAVAHRDKVSFVLIFRALPPINPVFDSNPELASE